MTALARYEDRGVPFSSWILRIAHNLAIDHIRRRVATADVEAAERAEAPDDRRSRELGQALREALESLPPVQRKVIVMRHVGGMSPGEIADRLERSEDAVHGLHHRGRRALKQALVERDAAPMVAAA
jgi:RNA polymerase sigma-70 factor (ECF subfamily)